MRKNMLPNLEQSEHELGIAVDINADTSSVLRMLFIHGLPIMHINMVFIKRYPDNKIEITGVNNEPWHYRYVGVDAAPGNAEKDCVWRSISRL